MNSQQPLYSLTGVSHIYNDDDAKPHLFKRWRAESVEALRDVTLDIQSGEFLCVVGRSGEGKSTLLHLLGGLEPPTRGQLEFKGQALTKRKLVRFRRQHVGFVFQMFHLFPHKTAIDNVALGMTMTGASQRVARREAQVWLERLGLEHRLHFYPCDLSGGEKQRIAIARAVIKRPDVILADEPTGNLDKESRAWVLDGLAELNRESGITVVMVTHNLDDAESYGSRIVEIDGRTIARQWEPNLEPVSN